MEAELIRLGATMNALLSQPGDTPGKSAVGLGIMIVTTTRIRVSSANRSELFQTILTLLTPLKNEKGCLNSHFYLDSADSNSAMLVEEWEAEEDWQNHLRSRECAVFMGAVKVLCGPKNLEFMLLSYVAGLDAITSVRSIDAIDHS
jgi:quinol monooxygenase YgiN